MKCISCGKTITPDNSYMGQCTKCEAAEARERSRVDWRNLTDKQAAEKDKEIEEKYSRYANG